MNIYPFCNYVLIRDCLLLVVYLCRFRVRELFFDIHAESLLKLLFYILDLLSFYSFSVESLSSRTTYLTGVNISLVGTIIELGTAPRVMWFALLNAKAAKVRISSHGFWSSSSLFQLSIVP